MAQQIDFDPSVDYYKALGVGQKATPDEIKKAYRNAAKAYHPDSTGGDKVKETRFKEISNAYDVLGEPKKRSLYDQIRAQGGMPQQGFPGAYTSSRGPGGAGAPSVFDLGDLFSQLFTQQQGGRQRTARRVDPFESGDAEFDSKVKASDGSWLDVKGVDVYSDVRISFDRAILGTVATVPTVGGKAEVKVPSGTSSGKKLRLRGKGVSDRSGRVGDHYITVQIDVPRDLDDDAKKQLVQFVSRLRKRGHND